QGAVLQSVAMASLASLQCNPTTLSAGGTSTCTVALTSAAPTGGLTVGLSDNSAALTVPGSVFVPAGATSASFSATAGNSTFTQSARITATLNGVTASATLTLTGSSPAALSALSCNPTTLRSNGSSTCTVTLSAAAPAGGTRVTVSSNTGSLNVPASV